MIVMKMPAMHSASPKRDDKHDNNCFWTSFQSNTHCRHWDVNKQGRRTEIEYNINGLNRKRLIQCMKPRKVGGQNTCWTFSSNISWFWRKRDVKRATTPFCFLAQEKPLHIDKAAIMALRRVTTTAKVGRSSGLSDDKEMMNIKRIENPTFNSSRRWTYLSSSQSWGPCREDQRASQGGLSAWYPPIPYPNK